MSVPRLPVILSVAVERRYLSEELAAELAAHAQRSAAPLERLLAERAGLSPRRLERLQGHVRYRMLRKADKVYAREALGHGLVSREALEAGLAAQRARFEERREVVRLGDLLLEQGALGAREDRALRARVAKVSQAGDGSGSAASIAMHESSWGQTSQPSFERIESAVRQVERVRKQVAEVSVSEHEEPRTPLALADEVDPAVLDSAAEVESACAALARRRVSGEGPVTHRSSGSRSSGLRSVAPAPARADAPNKKSTGLRRILGIGAAP